MCRPEISIPGPHHVREVRVPGRGREELTLWWGGSLAITSFITQVDSFVRQNALSRNQGAGCAEDFGGPRRQWSRSAHLRPVVGVRIPSNRRRQPTRG